MTSDNKGLSQVMLLRFWTTEYGVIPHPKVSAVQMDQSKEELSPSPAQNLDCWEPSSPLSSAGMMLTKPLPWL